MATYTKSSISVSGTTLMGYEFSGDSAVFEELNTHKTAVIKGAENEVLIPFHAVKQYQKGVTLTETERADAYCE